MNSIDGAEIGIYLYDSVDNEVFSNTIENSSQSIVEENIPEGGTNDIRDNVFIPKKTGSSDDDFSFELLVLLLILFISLGLVMGFSVAKLIKRRLK